MAFNGTENGQLERNDVVVCDVGAGFDVVIKYDS
jgi:hypothetical protein